VLVESPIFVVKMYIFMGTIKSFETSLFTVDVI
jgi:hypothetical protein